MRDLSTVLVEARRGSQNTVVASTDRLQRKDTVTDCRSGVLAESWTRGCGSTHQRLAVPVQSRHRVEWDTPTETDGQYSREQTTRARFVTAAGTELMAIPLGRQTGRPISRCRMGGLARWRWSNGLLTCSHGCAASSTPSAPCASRTEFVRSLGDAL